MAYGLGKIQTILTHSHQQVTNYSSKVCGKVSMACVHSTMFHGIKTCGQSTPYLQRLRLNDHLMIHWICEAKDQDETCSTSLQQIGIDDIAAVLDMPKLKLTDRELVVNMRHKIPQGKPVTKLKHPLPPANLPSRKWKYNARDFHSNKFNPVSSILI